MSTDSSSRSPDTSRPRSGTRDSQDTIERFREPVFVGLLVVGTAVLAIGLAFLILSVTMDTTPPAPYFTTGGQKYAVVAGSIVASALGVLSIRAAARLAGW